MATEQRTLTQIFRERMKLPPIQSRPTTGNLTVFSRDSWIPDEVRDLALEIRRWTPKSELGRLVKRAFNHLPPELAKELFDRSKINLIIESRLYARILRGEEVLRWGNKAEWEEYGLQCEKMVDTTGVNWIVGIFTGSNSPTIMKFHGIGTNNGAPAISDTALGTELTTQYQTANTRATGTTTTGASNNIYQTVGTNQVNTTVTVQEHGIFTSATSGAGTLIDRSLIGPFSLVNTDQVQTTFNLTFAAGG